MFSLFNFRDIELSIFDNTNNLGQPSTSYISPFPKSSNSTKQQKCDEIEEGRDYSKDEQNLSLSSKINTNNLKDLIVALTDSVSLQNVCLNIF